MCKFNPDGNVIGTTGEDSNIRLWDFKITKKGKLDIKL